MERKAKNEGTPREALLDAVWTNWVRVLMVLKQVRLECGPMSTSGIRMPRC